MSKVLLIVVDALASRVVRPALEEGRLPHLKALAEAGWVRWDSTAIFPSITPAATAALVTGGYPAESGITGAYFYDVEQDRVHYYGDDTWVILRQGFGKFFEDFLVQLNDRLLRLETLYQSVERAGGRAACLNFLWFHGDHEHTVRVPWLLSLWPTVPFSKTVHGPAWLALGDFVAPQIDGRRRLRGKGGMRRRFGFHDDTTSEQLLQLAAFGNWPELTLAYFPNNDFASHDAGPLAALPCVEAVDRTLGRLIQQVGGLEALLREVRVIITGDHAQSDLPLDEERTGIRLDELLSDFQVAGAGLPWEEGDEIMVCPNMRAAQIYVHPKSWPRRFELEAKLLSDERIDQVIWREAAIGESPRYHVTTRDRGRLEFWPDPGHEPLGRDEYGQGWSWQGALSTVDAAVDDNGSMRYGDYPNALERIVTAFDERVSGDFWITSRLEHEFRLALTKVNPRGSHGSLHALDSLSPLIVAGHDLPQWPETPRSVDVAPLCRKLLGLDSAWPLGGRRSGEWIVDSR